LEKWNRDVNKSFSRKVGSFAVFIRSDHIDVKMVNFSSKVKIQIISKSCCESIEGSFDFSLKILVFFDLIAIYFEFVFCKGFDFESLGLGITKNIDVKTVYKEGYLESIV